MTLSGQATGGAGSLIGALDHSDLFTVIATLWLNTQLTTLRGPIGIVTVTGPCNCVGNLVENGITNFSLIVQDNEGSAQTNFLATETADAETVFGIVKLKCPLIVKVLTDKLNCHLSCF